VIVELKVREGARLDGYASGVHRAWIPDYLYPLYEQQVEPQPALYLAAKAICEHKIQRKLRWLRLDQLDRLDPIVLEAVRNMGESTERYFKRLTGRPWALPLESCRQV